MYKWLFILIMAVSGGMSAQAHEAHTHGTGELSIAQDQQQWFVEFRIPAMDLLGFEQAPKNAAQEKAVQSLKNRLTEVEQVIQFPDTCTIEGSEWQLPGDRHGHASHGEHSDVLLQYRFQCQGPVTEISVTLFSWANSLTQLETQWLTDASVSARVLTPRTATLVF